MNHQATTHFPLHSLAPFTNVPFRDESQSSTWCTSCLRNLHADNTVAAAAGGGAAGGGGEPVALVLLCPLLLPLLLLLVLVVVLLLLLPNAAISSSSSSCCSRFRFLRIMGEATTMAMFVFVASRSVAWTEDTCGLGITTHCCLQLGLS
jgi:hypothetical protein